jgi:hypothetical protein
MGVGRGWCWLLIGLLFLPTGCTPTKKKKSAEAVRADVAECFNKLQAAIDELRDGDPEKLWELLAEQSKADAAKKAKAFRTDFAKRDKEEQAEIARKFGATVEEVRDKFSGLGYFRWMSDKIYERYFLMVKAEVDHVTLDGDEATVYYRPDDATRNTKSVEFVREDGRWRAILSIP